eukprot:7517122-Pyramimonas_sp.AAC.1
MTRRGKADAPRIPQKVGLVRVQSGTPEGGLARAGCPPTGAQVAGSGGLQLWSASPLLCFWLG